MGCDGLGRIRRIGCFVEHVIWTVRDSLTIVGCEIDLLGTNGTMSLSFYKMTKRLDAHASSAFVRPRCALEGNISIEHTVSYIQMTSRRNPATIHSKKVCSPDICRAALYLSCACLPRALRHPRLSSRMCSRNLKIVCAARHDNPQ